MVHYVVLHKLRDKLPEKEVENLMVQARIRLLKIPEVMNMRCGKKIDSGSPYDFFISFDAENMSKLKMVQDHALFSQLSTQILAPASKDAANYHFEMEPAKDVRYS